MVAKAEELVQRLGSTDEDTKLRALRAVKNQIIGNKTKKLSYIRLGAVPRVVDILAQGQESTMLVQSAATVGSFGSIADGLAELQRCGGVQHLLRTLNSSDEKVVEAGVRSLKMIFQVQGFFFKRCACHQAALRLALM